MWHKHCIDSELRLRRRQGRNAFVFAENKNRGVFAVYGIAMNNDPPFVDVKDPVIWNPGSGVEGSLRLCVDLEAGVRNFDYEMKLICLKTRGEMREVPPQY